MVATDVASRGIGMIKEDSSLPPYSLPALVQIWCFLLSSRRSPNFLAYSSLRSLSIGFPPENYFDLGVQLPWACCFAYRHPGYRKLFAIPDLCCTLMETSLDMQSCKWMNAIGRESEMQNNSSHGTAGLSLPVSWLDANFIWRCSQHHSCPELRLS